MRHKYDKKYAGIGARRRATEMFVTVVEDLPSFVFNMFLLSEKGLNKGGTQLMALTVSCSNVAFKLLKLWRNSRELEELQKRQHPDALQAEVTRAIESKSFKHAREIMAEHAEVPFLLAGSSEGDLEGAPTLDFVLSPADAGRLLGAVAEAAEVALTVKLGQGLASSKCKIFKVLRLPITCK